MNTNNPASHVKSSLKRVAYTTLRLHNDEMDNNTEPPTLYLAITHASPYDTPYATVKACVLSTIESLKDAPRNPLGELGALALNEEQDTLQITRPYHLAGKPRGTAILAALKDIVEDLRLCGYNVSVTSEDTLSTFTPLNP